jgi:hypothetical protein
MPQLGIRLLSIPHLGYIILGCLLIVLILVGYAIWRAS